MPLLLSILLLVLVLAGVLAWFSRWTAARIERAFLPAGEWLELDGERIHYRAFIEGPAMVMVHGRAGQMRNFDYLPLQDLIRSWTGACRAKSCS
jgi:hypothetical protein